MRVCWNRQTGKLEVLVFDWTCGFKSHHSHHFPLFVCREKNIGYARVVELADSLDSGSSAHYGRAGSSPASRTISSVLTAFERLWEHSLFIQRVHRGAQLTTVPFLLFTDTSGIDRGSAVC